MTTKSMRIRARNELDSWLGEQIENGLSLEHLKFVLSDKLNDLLQSDFVKAERKQNKIDSNFEELSLKLADFFSIDMSVSKIKETLKDDYLLLCIEKNEYTDTHIIEQIANELSMSIVGMTYPTYGDSKERKERFRVIGKEIGFLK